MIDHVKVREFEPSQVACELHVLVGNTLVVPAHVIEHPVRRKPDTGTLRTDGSDDRPRHIQGKPVAAAPVAAIFVLPPIGTRIEELGDQVPVGAMDLDPFEPAAS